jgi:hypothetical protein
MNLAESERGRKIELLMPIFYPNEEPGLPCKLCMRLCMCMIRGILALGFIEFKAGVLACLQKPKISCASNTWCRARA